MTLARAVTPRPPPGSKPCAVTSRRQEASDHASAGRGKRAAPSVPVWRSPSSREEARASGAAS